jgi:hypothetical protein
MEACHAIQAVRGVSVRAVDDAAAALESNSGTRIASLCD